MALPTSGPLSLSQIHGEFGGPTPVSLSNYYRRPVLSAITDYVFSGGQPLNSMLASENGTFPSDFSEGFKYYTTDYTTLFPRDPMGFVMSLGQAEIVNADGRDVAQTNGTVWGTNSSPRTWGNSTYFKIKAGDTYRFFARVRETVAPTNTNGHQTLHVLGLEILGANGRSVAGYHLVNNTLSSSWTTNESIVSGDTILAAIPGAVWARLIQSENHCSYYDEGSNLRTIPANNVVQTSDLGVDLVSGSLNGSAGFTTAYEYQPSGNGRAWTKSGNSMVLDQSKNLSDLGSPRQCTNPLTKTIYRLGNFTVMDSPGTMGIPTSGEIKLSDFYGATQDGAPQWATPSELGSVNSTEPFSFTLSASSSSPVSIVDVILPSWMSFNPSTGVVTGTAPFISTVELNAAIEMAATNQYLTTTRVFHFVVVNRPPVWNTSSGNIVSVTSGQGVNYQLSATDPDGSAVVYRLVSGSLPSGISMSPTGHLTGSSSSVGTHTFTVGIEDNVPRTDINRQFSITISETSNGGGGGGGGLGGDDDDRDHNSIVD